MKKLFYDLETTGLDKVKNGIHQIAGCVEIDGEAVEWFDFKVKPLPTDEIDAKALEIAHVKLEDVLKYDEAAEVHKKFTEMLGKYVNKFSKEDKFFLYGFNNKSFDDPFMREWFTKVGDKYYGSWFWNYSSDVMVLAVDELMADIPKMENFKLVTVAKHLGITIREDKLHDARYDIWLTREIYNRIKKK